MTTIVAASADVYTTITPAIADRGSAEFSHVASLAAGMMGRMSGTGVLARSSNRTLGVAAVAIATCVWATGSVLVKWSSLSGLHFAMFRLWVGAAISCGALLVARRRLSWRTVRTCAFGGVLFATDIALHFSAVKRTSVADVAVIGALAPVVIVIVSTRAARADRPA